MKDAARGDDWDYSREGMWHDMTDRLYPLSAMQVIQTKDDESYLYK